jgi:uncharacterized protein (DUF169 family)
MEAVTDSGREAKDHRTLAGDLTKALHLAAPPVGISFSDEAPLGVSSFDEPMSAPTSDGRTGRVPAGCVFWVRGAERVFTTVPEDHGNCSVGRYTHGLAGLEEIAGYDDVAALLESQWIGADDLGTVPAISRPWRVITYGPLADHVTLPDVVLLRVNGRQMMVLSDAVPPLRIEGKPQCHIVAVAHERGDVVASVGCALSRARTGMRPEEMTVAFPGARLSEVTACVERSAAIDAGVAKYAAEDARRFAPTA